MQFLDIDEAHRLIACKQGAVPDFEADTTQGRIRSRHWARRAAQAGLRCSRTAGGWADSAGGGWRAGSVLRRGVTSKETPRITAIVLYDLPPSIGLEECRAYFTKIAPDFFKIPGFLRKQFICARGGKVAGGVYMWESQETAERFYSREWLAGIRARYGTEPKITYFEA